MIPRQMPIDFERDFPKEIAPIRQEDRGRKSQQERNWNYIRKCEATNHECAKIIRASAQRYGGTESLMVGWADMVLEGYQPSEQHWHLVA